jgi:hypothetical protein
MEKNIIPFMSGGQEKSDEKQATKKIAWADVTRMRDLYLNHPNAPRVPTPGGTEILRGLSISKANVDAILSQNPDDIMVVFAVRKQDADDVEEETIGAEEYDRQFFTTVIVGMKNGLLIKDNAYDYCEPCPSKCGTL